MSASGSRSRDDDAARIREATDIVRLVGEHVALKAKGREFVGLCPFHDDRTPSMCVVPHKQIYHCFVCGAGGDVYTFLQKFLRIEFREAIEMLAERAGIELKPRHAAPAAPDAVTRQDLQKASAFAQEFFRAILRHESHGMSARALIEKRGLTPEIVEQFGIGASPARWDGLLLTLRERDRDPSPFAEAGLLKRRDSDNSFYDSFRNRLMFPICDAGGRVIAFGARRIDDADDPKYLNSSDSRLFSKSNTLFALHHASREIQATRTAIITEGYMDAIACHQGGFRNAVATLGTSVTRDHAANLRRLCRTVVMLFDGDEAGLRASDRAVEVFFSEPIDVRIATLAGATDAKDPDELLKREGGADVFRQVIASARDVFEFRFERLKSRLTGAGPAAIANAMDEEIAKLVDLGLGELRPLQKEKIVSHLARLAGVDRAAIMRAIPAGRGRRPFGATAPVTEETSEADHTAGFTQRALSAREHVLACVLAEPKLLPSLEDRSTILDASTFDDVTLGEVAWAVLLSGVTSGDGWTLADVLDTLASKGQHAGSGDAAVALASRVDRECRGEEIRIRAGFDESLARVRRESARGTAGGGTLKDRIDARRREVETAGADRRLLPKRE